MNFNDILSLYEDFKQYEGILSGKEGFFEYRAPSSRHSDVTSFAYGMAEVQTCTSIKNGPCTSTISVPASDLSRRFYVKLKACLFQWRTFICPIQIRINGVLAYENDREFFENVNVGWPTLYLPIDNRLLQEGENLIELRQGDAESYLLISRIDLLSLPGLTPGQQLTCLPSVRANDTFSVSLYAPNMNIVPAYAKGCEIIKITRSPLHEDRFILQLRAWEEDPQASVLADGKEIYLVLPRVFPANEDRCFIGTDSDDHRQDYSDEAERILDIFTNTGMGNFWQARPKSQRNYIDLPDKETWRKRIDYLKEYNTTMSISQSNHLIPYFGELAGEHYLGEHFHESYLFFCAALERSPSFMKELFMDLNAIRGSQSFGESKELYCTALDSMYESIRMQNGLTSIGSPSLLTSYEAASRFERVTIEPTTMLPLLIGAVRGAKPQMWGAHVPTDWYYGEPNDRTKVRKFLLAMELLYLFGARYIYAENALFKTNAFSREDWDDDFCIQMRKSIRDFYAYTIENPREGELQNELAVIYGNHEFIMWHYDNRLAEMEENGNWDAKLWGKWEDNRHHKCWRALDAWIPPAEKQHTRNNILNQDLFGGTPYGAVDIIPFDKSYSGYKAIALLGWNTYEEGFATKLYDYVSSGGTAFVSYCHFNKTDRCDMPFVYASSPEIQALIGEVSDTLLTTPEGYRVCSCTAADAEALITDEAGNILVWKRKIGKGTFYFGTFADYECPVSKREVMMEVLHICGETTASIRCDNNNICFTNRLLPNGKRVLHILNVSSADTEPQDYTLTLRSGKTITGKAKVCEIQTIRI